MPKINLPDLDDMATLVDRMGELTKRKTILEAQLRIYESNIVKEYSTKILNNKPMSMDFIKNSYMITGPTNELTKYRAELAMITGELDALKLKFQFYQDLIGLYRTEAANQRLALQ